MFACPTPGFPVLQLFNVRYCNFRTFSIGGTILYNRWGRFTQTNTKGWTNLVCTVAASSGGVCRGDPAPADYEKGEVKNAIATRQLKKGALSNLGILRLCCHVSCPPSSTIKPRVCRLRVVRNRAIQNLPIMCLLISYIRLSSSGHEHEQLKRSRHY